MMVSFMLYSDPATSWQSKVMVSCTTVSNRIGKREANKDDKDDEDEV